MATLLADLEDTHGDVPVIPHAHSGMAQPKRREWEPTAWERQTGRLWVQATLDVLRQKSPPVGCKDPT